MISRIRVPAPVTVGAAALVALGTLALRPAQAAVAIEGTFEARAACPAYQSFNDGTNPGDVALRPGTTYGAFEINQPNGGWVRLRVPGAAPLDRWVARECGVLAVTSPAGPDPTVSLAPALADAPLGATAPMDDPAMTGDDAADPAVPGDGLVPLMNNTVVAASPAEPFPWFFDRIDDGAEDRTPPPPVLGQVDFSVLRLCGDWGDTPTAADFRIFLEEHPGLRNTLVTTLSGSPDAGDEDLVGAWFDADGFRHVFCGEPDQRVESGWNLGGLHYMGRYAQAQLNGWAGLLTGGCSVIETAPPIYTQGVVFRAPDGTTGVKCINGYALGLTAPDMLHEITKATADARRRFGSSGQYACRRQILDDGHSYEAVFVIRDGAIVTFYPDATPDESLPYCQG
ncbi:EndoU domain-containing protein [Roseospira visakhapatnamensis]|uniref:Bacterial EndoU nuclease domain-containing protein n=1 Tax=Roseospira visakhapatnamensis TaxID=390880 RepID=A0A7W6W8P2_9PROT|nr:EndoU domain-containing protein [Roseospira visakhapatnamensis]MBB4264621.1 hypothetical protein [Roseospira visakhapatnamensis]